MNQLETLFKTMELVHRGLQIAGLVFQPDMSAVAEISVPGIILQLVMITILILATIAGVTGAGVALSYDPIYTYEREGEL